MTALLSDIDQLTCLYRRMLLIRRCEEQLAKAHQRGLVHGACHTYVGQEAVAVGVCARLRSDDTVFSTHRGHGHALAKGVPPAQLLAELYGRATGCSQGRGGSMHLFAPEVGLMGTSGIVAACILQAAGAGYSIKLLRTDRVAVAFFGDGAVNNGAFHEGLNLASIWKLPVLFVCENNQYATEVPFRYAAGNPMVAGRAAAYGMPGVEVDGNDVVAVHTAAGEAILRARRGEGPTLLECRTYRTRTHAEGMGDFSYRTREEVEEWKSCCPILRLKRLLNDEVHVTEDVFKAIEAAVAAQVEEAHRQAEASAWPEPATATSYIYAEPVRTVPPPPRPGSRELSYMQATLEALTAEMAANPRIFVLGEGIGKRGGNFKTTAGLYDLYGPERLCDTPISERGFVGLGCGAAMTGTRPVIDFMFADFVLDGVGEIVNQIAKMQYMSSGRLRMPLLLRGCVGIGHSAATHHSGNYYPMYAHFPGLRVVLPSTPYDAKGLLHHALRCDDPVLFLEHRELLALKGPVPEEAYEIPFGQAAVVREGKDITVVALAFMVQRTLQACERLASDGISVELIDPRTVAPLDTETIARSVAKTGRLLIVDEAFAPCGIGAEIAARLGDTGFDDLDAPIRRLNGAHTPTPYSPPLEAAIVPNSDTIAQAVRNLWRSEGHRMAIPIIIPRLGWNMETGVFVGWLKSEGATVRAGETLFSLESDKSTEDIECLDAGILRIPPDGPQPGDQLAVGAVIGYLVAVGEAAPFEASTAQGQPGASPPASPSVRRLARARGIDLATVAGSAPGGRITAEDLTPMSVTTVPPARPERRAISPRARRVARELGVDWTELCGSGRTGRIRERDVRAAAGTAPAAAAPVGNAVPVSPIRRTIAERMLTSHRSTAPVTLTTTADASNLVNLRNQFKAADDKGVPSYTDLLVKLTAVALTKHPLLNARWEGEQIVALPGIHIGIAVDTDAGLLVPVVRDVPGLGMRQLMAQTRDLAARARAGKLAADELRGGTFTLTNLGAFGIDAFTPIINFPQGAILGVGRIERRPAVVGEQIVARDQLTLSLTFDHRIVDGAPAARFLQTLRGLLENPGPALVA